MSQFPIRRMRRLRRTPALRRLVQETHLVPAQLVWPLFVCHGEGVRREVTALPGVYQTSVDELVKDAERARRLGLGGIILFGLPATKDATGSEAYDEQGIVQQAARAVKRATPDLLVIGDACLCEYTDHGHCGVVQDGDVDNDASVYLLGKVAVTQARAGIDIVAPSDMMDGRVAGIRKALDAAGFSRVPIMSYAAKMASAFYGPFREAAGSTPQFGDRQTYQMQGTNADEAMKEIRLDVAEGADIVLVKPALPCLDLIRRAREEFGAPLAAYQVSGEYAMIAGPNARAGFIIAPVNGPPTSAHTKIASPIPKPPILGDSDDTAVPNTALTRKKVSIASIRMPCRPSVVIESCGVPAAEACTGPHGKMTLSSAAPTRAPSSCAP